YSARMPRRRSSLCSHCATVVLPDPDRPVNQMTVGVGSCLPNGMRSHRRSCSQNNRILPTNSTTPTNSATSTRFVKTYTMIAVVSVPNRRHEKAFANDLRLVSRCMVEPGRADHIGALRRRERMSHCVYPVCCT